MIISSGFRGSWYLKLSLLPGIQDHDLLSHMELPVAKATVVNIHIKYLLCTLGFFFSNLNLQIIQLDHYGKISQTLNLSNHVKQPYALLYPSQACSTDPGVFTSGICQPIVSLKQCSHLAHLWARDHWQVHFYSRYCYINSL